MLDPFELYALLGFRVVVGLVFALAAGGKARDVPAFAQSVVGLGRVPPHAARGVAWALLTAETAVVVLMLVGGPALWWGFGLATLLLSAFSAAILVALARGRRVTCNCFGHSDQPMSVPDLLRNAGLLGCAVTAMALLAGGTAPTTPLAAADSLLAGAIAATLVTVLLHLNEIVMLVRPPSTPGQPGSPS